MIIPISKTKRICLIRNGMSNQAQFQVRETTGWETVCRKSYDGNWKGNIVEDMLAVYKAEKKPETAKEKKARESNEDYLESKMKPYH